MSDPLPLDRQLKGCSLSMETGEGGGQYGRCHLASGGRAGNEFLGNLPTKGSHRGFWSWPVSGTQPPPPPRKKGQDKGPFSPPRGSGSAPPPPVSASPLSLAQRESSHQEFSVTFKNCGKRNSREDRGEGGERKRSVARSRQDKSWGDEEANIFF